MAQFFVPKKFPKGLITIGQTVFEVDEQYVTKHNEHGVGRAFGSIKEEVSRGKILVEWHDTPKQTKGEVVLLKNLKLAPQLEQEFLFDDKLVRCVDYKKSTKSHGCVVEPLDETTQIATTKSPAKSTRATTKSPAQATPKSPASPAEATPKSRWIKCKAPALSNTDLEKAANLTTSLCSNEPTYILFAQRAIREYKKLQKSGPLHMNLRKALKSAVGQVMQQVRPKNARPAHGNSATVTDELLPVVENFFGIKRKLKPGSNEHITQLIEEDLYTLQDCLSYTDVMDYHIKQRKCHMSHRFA